MKTTILSSLLVWLSFSACKKEMQPPAALQAMTVLKDCTGFYLRIDGKDYQVCNVERGAPYSDGTPVKAGFTKIENCKAPEIRGACALYHANEGWITVTELETLPD